jgi:DNA-binding GntR family transcriptional regulator
MKGKTVKYAAKVAGQRSDAEVRLTQLVIESSLRGESVFLREEESAEQLGVGRTVVRAMLSRLSGRGIVEHVPRRGWQVCAFSESRMGEYLEVRELLELRALELAADRLERKELDRLLIRNSPMKNGRVRIDNALHGYWIERAGNRYISEFFSLHGQYFAALFDYASLEGSIIAEMAGQHHAILRALLDGNIGTAKKVLRLHIRSQRPNVARLMACVANSTFK